MNRFLIYAIVLFFSISAVNVYSQDDTAGITKTALDYMEGWYQNDAKRMKASLHKRLAKRSLQAGHGNKKNLRLTSASDMITYTQQGYGAGLWREGMEIDVVILDPFKDIASVKVVTPHYYGLSRKPSRYRYLPTGCNIVIGECGKVIDSGNTNLMLK